MSDSMRASYWDRDRSFAAQFPDKAAKIVDLKAQVETLTHERNDFRQRLSSVNAKLMKRESEAIDLFNRVDAVINEVRNISADLVQRTAQRDELKVQLAALTAAQEHRPLPCIRIGGCLKPLGLPCLCDEDAATCGCCEHVYYRQHPDEYAEATKAALPPLAASSLQRQETTNETKDDVTRRDKRADSGGNPPHPSNGEK